MCQNGKFLLFLAHAEYRLNSDYIENNQRKGKQKRTGGSAVGTEKKTTKEIRILLKEVLIMNYLILKNCELPPKERLDLILKIMPYVLLKVNNVEHCMDEPLDWGNQLQ